MAGELVGREALERIVRRAAELQAGEREIGEGLTSAEVLALGKDVGIPERYLRQAMLEEQTRTAPEPAAGTWAWLAGPRTLVAHRVVPGDRAGVERALTRWMEDEELLQPKRRFPDRTTWESKAGAFASIQRALAGSRRYALTRVTEVSGQVVQLEPGFCLVRLAADVASQRSARLGGLATLTALGAAAGWGIAFAGVAPPIAIAAAGAFLFGGIAAARSHAKENEKVHVALEQVLDRLERGEVRLGKALPGTGPLGRIAEEIKRTLEI